MTNQWETQTRRHSSIDSAMHPLELERNVLKYTKMLRKYKIDFQCRVREKRRDVQKSMSKQSA